MTTAIPGPFDTRKKECVVHVTLNKDEGNSLDLFGPPVRENFVLLITVWMNSMQMKNVIIIGSDRGLGNLWSVRETKGDMIKPVVLLTT